MTSVRRAHRLVRMVALITTVGLPFFSTTPAAAQMILASRKNGNTMAQDTTYLDAVIRFDIDGGPSAILPALVYNSTLLLPFREVAQMAGIRLEAFELRDSAAVLLEPGSVRLVMRPQVNQILRGSQPVTYRPRDATWWERDLYVATGLLDTLLGVSTIVEWSTLSAVMGQATHLPVLQRARRARRRAVLDITRRPGPRTLEIPLQERAVDGAVVTWNLTAASMNGSEQRSLDLGIGAGLLGGSAELRPVFWSGGGVTGAEVRASWTRSWPTSQWIQQARLGDVNTNGRRSMLLQGAVLTNAPFIRSSQFDVEQFVGDVPPGWEVELYDGGRLLAYADADAMGAFRVPIELRYGQNPFELVLYGPGGEAVHQKRTIRVPFSRLPSGRLEYAVAAGRCRIDPCNGLVSADARYGLSTNLTVQGGLDAFARDTVGTLFQPYAIVSASPVAALGITAEAVLNGHLRAGLDVEPHSDIRLHAGHTWFSQAGLGSLALLRESARSEASLFWRPGVGDGSLYVQGAGALSTGPDFRQSTARIATTKQFGRIRLSLGALSDAQRRAGTTTRRFALDAGTDAVLTSRSRLLRGAVVQGQFAVEPSRGFTAVRTGFGRPVARTFRVDLGLGWFRGTGVSLELSLSTAMPGPRFGTRSRVSTGSGPEALVSANGALAWDPRSHLLKLGDQGDLGRAGVRGVIFRDDNNNGRRDGAEPGLSDVPLYVGGWAARTDKEGRFSTWGVAPSEPVRIDVDSLSFGDPHLMLPAPVLQVRPAPNSFGTIEVPVVVGAEISGFVVMGDEAIGGVPVVLREINTGAEFRAMTFADGGFYRAAIPPGEYEVTLPDQILEQLRAYAPPLVIFVPPGAGEKRFEDLHLRLERRP